jgi:hypothetical protein
VQASKYNPDEYSQPLRTISCPDVFERALLNARTAAESQANSVLLSQLYSGDIEIVSPPLEIGRKGRELAKEFV